MASQSMAIPIKPVDASEREHTDDVQRITQAADAQAKRKENLSGVKRIIGVHSGKGGVGKTFLSCNLAYALAARGLSIGLLDGDVDCPNVPTFLQLKQQLFIDKEKRFKPVVHDGVRIVSMGLTRDDDTQPFLIRGPAKHRVAVDLLTNTAWGELDVLIVDLPPGTSDVPMSLLEFGGLSGILFVTTPHKEAIIDTRKAIRMAHTFGIHPIGIVENMTGDVFGGAQGQLLAAQESLPLLCSIPLSAEIFAVSERGEIAFLLPALKDVVAPVVDAVLHAYLGDGSLQNKNQDTSKNGNNESKP
jgi:ATP-binding protein involved in chromosome partitioning